MAEKQQRIVTPDSVHPDYESMKETRSLSLALQEGIPAFIRDAEKGERKWIKPEPGEDKPTGGDINFVPFKERYNRLWFNNVYAECLRGNAAVPFKDKMTVTNWSDVLNARLNGEGKGVDGQGRTVTQYYSSVFENRLFAGIHFGRLALDGPIPLWRHVHANDLKDWVYEFDSGEFRLLGACISTQEGKGRIVFNIENGKVIEGVYKSSDKAKGIRGKAWEQVGKDIVYPGLVSCPVYPFYSSWSAPFVSPPMFADAAFAQLRLIHIRSLLDRKLITGIRSGRMVVTGFSGAKARANVKTGELEEPEALPQRGHVLSFPDAETKVSEYSSESESLERIRKDIEEGESAIRRQCNNPMRQRQGGDVKAAEIHLTEARSQTLLSLIVQSDMATLTTMARDTDVLIGSVAPDDASISMDPAFFKNPNHEVVDEVATFFDKGLVDREFFLKVARDNMTSVNADHWKELLERLAALEEAEKDETPDLAG
jgi:hypothetical protein